MATDEQLARRAQQGDTVAMETLVRRHAHVARIIAARYFVTGGDRDDLRQEALVGLWKAIRDYQDGHGATFETFVDLCVERQVITAIKTANRLKHQPLNEAFMFSKIVHGVDGDRMELGDLFHEQVPDEFIAAAFDAFRLHPDRIFQVLTKRPERAAELLPELYDYAGRFEINDYAHDGRPLPNVWMGVSIENARFTWRADVLREIPAAVRFISAEPLLGSLFNDRRGAALSTDAPDNAFVQPLDLTGIDWVIIGGESGPGARPFHLEHAIEIIGHAVAESYHRTDFNDDAAVAVFVKQLGANPLAAQIGSSSVTGKPFTPMPLGLHDRKGGDMDEWPADLRIREFPRSVVPA